MKTRWMLAAGFVLLDLVLVACGGTGDSFAEAGGTDSTLHDGATEAAMVEEFFTVDTGLKDSGKQDSAPDAGQADTGAADTRPPSDVQTFDAPPDSRRDAVAQDVVEAGPFCGECEAGTLVDCMCGVHWTCTGGGCWVPHFTCSGTCTAPAMCLPSGAPVDLGVVECASGLAPDGGFLPCCSGGSSAYLCAGHCS